MNKNVKRNLQKGAFALSSLLLGFMIVATGITSDNADTITSALGQENAKVIHNENSSESTLHYKSKFNSIKEVAYNGLQTEIEEVEEGSVLLKNDNAALPLAKGSNVSLFGGASAYPLYGASGSGGINTAEALDFYEAFSGYHYEADMPKKDGVKKGDSYLNVNKSLYDFYKEKCKEPAKDWSGKVTGEDNPYSALASISQVRVGEVPWNMVSEHTNEVSQYGDAAIFVLRRNGGEGFDLPATSGANSQYGNENDKQPSVNDSTNGDYLQLSPEEKSVLLGLKSLKDQNIIKKIIFIMNTPNPVQCDFMDDPQYGIDAAFMTGSIGEVGSIAVAKLLTGEANFSGGLSQTIFKDNLMNPVNSNFTDQNYFFTYENFAEHGFTDYSKDNSQQSSMTTYQVYQEGMYLGYKYTETRYEDYVEGKDKVGNYQYSSVVSYPFGYGLSYTTFSFSDLKVKEIAENKVQVKVKVTNTGDKAGKTPVQVYVSKPYEDYAKNNSIQVPSVELIDFGKSSLLNPSQSEEISIDVDKKYLTTYDTFKEKTYVIMEGDYYITVANGAHNAINNILSKKGYTVENTSKRMDENGDASLVETLSLGFDKDTYSLSTKTGKPITNQFTEADINTYSGRGDNKVTYYTREDWEGTVKLCTRNEQGVLTKPHATLTMTSQMASELRDQFDADKIIVADDIEYPTYGAKNNLTLLSLKNESTTSPLWDKLLDQMTWDEMVDLLSNGRHKTQYIESVVKPATGDENGPNGYNNVYEHATQGSRFAGPTNPYSEFVNDPDIKPTDAASGSVWYSTTGFASNGVLASSFNKELAKKIGEQIGEEGLWSGHAGILGSGFNIQRTSYSGRNAEYYSEDAMLSGLIGAPETSGIESKGVHCFVKHFALNESETGRHGVQEWISEQALRENYLRAFEIVFEEGNANNVMTSFNRLGTTAVANSTEIANILRNEFGMPGIIETDYAGDMTGGSCEPYVSRIVNVYTGATELNETNYGTDATDYTGGKHTYKDYAPSTGTIHSGKLAWAMRNACKSILQATLTSEAINGYSSNDIIIRITPTWQKWVIAGDVAFSVLFAASLIWPTVDSILYYVKKKKEA